MGGVCPLCGCIWAFVWPAAGQTSGQIRPLVPTGPVPHQVAINELATIRLRAMSHKRPASSKPRSLVRNQ
eukprot:10961816-Lingulodinium_polyedra.AAC.1